MNFGAIGVHYRTAVEPSKFRRRLNFVVAEGRGEPLVARGQHNHSVHQAPHSGCAADLAPLALVGSKLSVA